MRLHIIIITFSLLIALSFANSIVSDYCVGDLSLPSGPAGYSCKNPTNLTVNDFVYSGLRVAESTANGFKLGANPAFVTQFPALNGLGISIVRADLEVDGFVPLHTHRVSELLIVIKGKVLAGFIDSNNVAYYKTLHKGDVMIFPPTLLHFQVNVGSTPVLAYASFASENPGVQIFDISVFSNDLPSKVIEKITLLDHAQVKKLKRLFGGTN